MRWDGMRGIKDWNFPSSFPLTTYHNILNFNSHTQTNYSKFKHTNTATMDKVNKNLTDIERKLTKTIKIVEKGPGMKLGDAVKLGTKSNSISSTIKKVIKEYEVSYFPILGFWDVRCGWMDAN